MTSALAAFNRALDKNDAGKLLLRLAVGGLMLFHGLHKLFDGVGGIQSLLAAHGLPEFIAYGTLVGEVAAPLLIVLGGPDPPGGVAGGVHHDCRLAAGGV